MLEIDMEYRKGVLFIRLIGELIESTIPVLEQEVTHIMKDYGIGNIVFNVEGLEVIDMKGINALLKHYELAKDSHGKVMLCGLKNDLVKHRIENSHLLNYMYEASDELTALSYMSY